MHQKRVTTIFDHHASYGEIKDSLFTIGDAARKMGVRSCLCYEISDRDGRDKAKEAVLENEAWIVIPSRTRRICSPA